MMKQLRMVLTLLTVLVVGCGNRQTSKSTVPSGKPVVMAAANAVSQKQLEEWLQQGAFRIVEACDVFEDDKCGPALLTDESSIWGYRGQQLHFFSVSYTKDGVWIYTHWSTTFSYDQKRQMLYMKKDRKGNAPETFIVHAISNGKLCCFSKPGHQDNPEVVCGYYVLRHLGEKEFNRLYEEWLNRGKKDRWEVKKK